MKRFLSILLVAVLALGLMATSAFADISIEAKPNEAVAVLKTDGVTFQSCLVELTLSEGMTLKSVSVDGTVLKGDGSKDKWDVSAVTSADQVADLNSMFAWYDQTNKIAFASALDQDVEGVVFTLTFDMGGKESGKVDAKITAYNEKQAGTEEFAVTTTSSANISVTASGVLYGDVNRDGKVNPADRAALARYLAKWPDFQDIDLSAADVNGDGKVNPADRAYLARHLAKWPDYAVLGKAE